ncbi:MAG: hypothetical protein E6R14_10545 [Thermomicrobiales bacterium]|nr:MAG: hypothetical protein E6R14_10545 [Thermomicrobiales bacterium]
MPKKTGGKTRVPKKAARHTMGRVKISRRRLLAMGAGVVAASALPSMPVTAAPTKATAAETIAALQALPFKKRLEHAVGLYKAWRATKTESDETYRRLMSSPLLPTSDRRALRERADALYLDAFDLDMKLGHAFGLALFAKDMTAEDEHIVETVLIPMHADFCRKKPEAMLKDWREFRARILARTSHAG